MFIKLIGANKNVSNLFISICNWCTFSFRVAHLNTLCGFVTNWFVWFTVDNDDNWTALTIILCTGEKMAGFRKVKSACCACRFTKRGISHPIHFNWYCYQLMYYKIVVFSIGLIIFFSLNTQFHKLWLVYSCTCWIVVHISYTLNFRRVAPRQMLWLYANTNSFYSNFCWCTHKFDFFSWEK